MDDAAVPMENEPVERRTSPPDAKPATGAPVIAFEHRLFAAMDGAYFRLSDAADALPVFVCEIGDREVLLRLPAIRREFGIVTGSRDDVMLDTVAESLRFVRALRAGDPVPLELLTGEASWPVDDRHRAAAANRLADRIVAWHAPSAAPGAVPAVAEAVAVDAAAAALGLEGGSDALRDALATLANELAAIEALAETREDRANLDRRMGAAGRLLRRSHDYEDLVGPVLRLMREARRDLNSAFAAFEALVPVPDAFAATDTAVAAIRAARDDLRTRLLAWEPLQARWAALDLDARPAILEMFQETYRFLAPRYMPIDEWERQMLPNSPRRARARDWQKAGDEAGGVKRIQWTSRSGTQGRPARGTESDTLPPTDTGSRRRSS
ncbi:MAG: hypothetical protein AB7N54_04565 [Alphaproteobacteria bacterium]